MLTDQEISSLQDVVPHLLSEAKTASPDNASFIFTMELGTHLQPGLRIRAPNFSIDSAPPFPLNLFVGIPIDELRTLAHATPTQRDQLIAHFGVTFSPRLLRAIQRFDAHTIDYDAGCQSEPGPSTVILEEPV
ncbi:hypothetical protein [Caballeronia sp. LjRoot31]|uniref:hypothetical protein n=1 Tax=Caballeronia sp. LjRoot31 TaxID=3342324 RepID=UPI003ECD8CE2